MTHTKRDTLANLERFTHVNRRYIKNPTFERLPNMGNKWQLSYELVVKPANTKTIFTLG